MSMKRWQSLVDEQAEKLIGDGDTSFLPNSGKPLNLGDEDESTPADLRLAHKIMKDHNVFPVWVMLGNEIDELSAMIRKSIRTSYMTYRGQLADARRNLDKVAEARAEQRWQKMQREIHQLILDHNKLALDYSLKAPSEVQQKARLDFQRELKKIQS